MILPQDPSCRASGRCRGRGEVVPGALPEAGSFSFLFHPFPSLNIFKLRRQSLRQDVVRAGFLQSLLSTLLDAGDTDGARDWMQRANEAHGSRAVTIPLQAGIKLQDESLAKLFQELLRSGLAINVRAEVFQCLISSG